MSVVPRFLGHDSIVAQCSSIDIIYYLPRRLMLSAIKKKDTREVRRVWKGVVVIEGGG